MMRVNQYISWLLENLCKVVYYQIMLRWLLKNAQRNLGNYYIMFRGVVDVDKKTSTDTPNDLYRIFSQIHLGEI